MKCTASNAAGLVVLVGACLWGLCCIACRLACRSQQWWQHMATLTVSASLQACLAVQSLAAHVHQAAAVSMACMKSTGTPAAVSCMTANATAACLWWSWLLQPQSSATPLCWHVPLVCGSMRAQPLMLKQCKHRFAALVARLCNYVWLGDADHMRLPQVLTA